MPWAFLTRALDKLRFSTLEIGEEQSTRHERNHMLVLVPSDVMNGNGDSVEVKKTKASCHGWQVRLNFELPSILAELISNKVLLVGSIDNS